MAFTSADLMVIEKAIASGVLRVKFSDREVQYQSLSELFKARDAIKNSLTGSTTGVTRATYASFTKD
jgi:hypothetical protein